MLTTIYTLAMVPAALRNFQHTGWAWIVVVLNVLAIANIRARSSTSKPLQAFLSSGFAITGFIFLFSIALFPNMVTAIDPANSLTIYNSASSTKTWASC